MSRVPVTLIELYSYQPDTDPIPAILGDTGYTFTSGDHLDPVHPPATGRRPSHSRPPRRGYSDPACLLHLLRLWKERKPETFTVRTLKSLLAAEGLHDMWMWINMMTQVTGRERPLCP